MSIFFKYKITPESIFETPNKSVFKIGPLEPGFGMTLGTALRRVLLSSIPGAAIFAIKIPEVTHEDSTIKGVVEDLSRIILNIKKIVLKVNEAIAKIEGFDAEKLETWPTLKIDTRNKGPIYARDIQLAPGFEVLTPDLKICELTEDRAFKMDLYATIDRGYQSFQENREKVDSLGIIAIDSMFSPILNAYPVVKEEKTSRRGNSDFLEMTIATNGSISANDAFALAAKILKEHLEPIIAINESISELEIMKQKEETQKKQVLSTSIDELELTMRSFNCLKRAGIHTIQELIDRTKVDIEKIRNLGKKSLKEIIRKLHERNLYFKDEAGFNNN